ncbi:hypothetical protein, partial [Actinomadura sp. RB99]|uniref:hypothetical protein n=1 Tax=Actinomadura sp. RB99 TaxID=2691577 RepID=UPI0019D5933C
MLDNEADAANAEGTDEETTATATGDGGENGAAAGVTSRPRRRASRPAGPPPDVEENSDSCQRTPPSTALPYGSSSSFAGLQRSPSRGLNGPCTR